MVLVGGFPLEGGGVSDEHPVIDCLDLLGEGQGSDLSQFRGLLFLLFFGHDGGSFISPVNA